MTKTITNVTKRRLSPTARPSGSTSAMLLAQVRAEFLAAFRVPEFLIGIVAIPVMLYAMFGLTSSGTLPDGTQVRALMMASFAAYGLLSLAIFTFGVDVAQDRKGGWLRLMRVAPMPAWVYFAGKFAMSVLFGVLTVLILFAVAALAGGVRLPLEKWLATFGVLLLGGSRSPRWASRWATWHAPRPRAPSPTWSTCPSPSPVASSSPSPACPSSCARWLPTSPPTTFGQLVWTTVGSREAAQAFTGVRPGGMLEHALWLLGTFVFFGVLALWGYRRDREEARS